MAYRILSLGVGGIRGIITPILPLVGVSRVTRPFRSWAQPSSWGAVTKMCLCAALASCVTPRAGAQSVQATRGAARQVEERVDSVLAVVRSELRTYRLLSDARGDILRANPDIRIRLERAIQRADALLAARVERDRRIRYAEFLEARTALSLDESRLGLNASLLRAAVPVLPAALPNVVFVTSADWSIGVDAPNVVSVSLSTNLLGAAAGAAFDVLGSGLKDYFTDNLSVGTSIPTGGPTTISPSVGVGLGGVKLGDVSFWPALLVNQFDAEDSRIPMMLVDPMDPERHWSQPTISVAVVPHRFLKRIQKGELAPLVTLGVGLPFFYPGDPFAALAALFTTGQDEFVKAGKVRVSLGLAIPLVRVTPLPEED